MPLRVRYYCHLQPTGYGMAALEYALGLARHPEVELDLRYIGHAEEAERFREQPGRSRELDAALDRNADYPDVVLVHTLPRDCPRVLAIERVAGRLHADCPAVAYTTWEARQMPGELAEELYKRFRLVLTPSQASADAIRTSVLERAQPHFDVGVLPHCYDPLMLDEVISVIGDHQNTADDFFTFYYVGAWNRRKNVEGVVRAFAHAFGGDPRAKLFLQCANTDPAQLPVAIAGTGFDHLPIRIDRNFVTAYTLWATHAAGDCFVTASRGEAWGLGSFEAMLAGRHIIAPDGQGSDEYLNGTYAWRYSSREEPACLHVTAEAKNGGLLVKASGPTMLTSQQTWWEPNLLELSKLMRNAFEIRQRTLGVAAPGRNAHMARFTQERVTKDLVQHLQGAIDGHRSHD